MSEVDWSARFDEVFSNPASAVQKRIWQGVFGDEYPDDDPYSYTTRSELETICRELALGAGETLVDIGCGRGGPGLFVAAQTGARLLGIDIAETALEAARDRAEALGLGETAAYRIGSFAETGLEAGAADAVMSIDALLFEPDKEAACRELARVTRPSGRLVLTTWDYRGRPPGRPPQVEDHRPLLAAAGFDVLRYDETPRWYERQDETNRELLASVDELAAESGADPDTLRSRLEEMAASLPFITRRVLAVAERRD